MLLGYYIRAGHWKIVLWSLCRKLCILASKGLSTQRGYVSSFPLVLLLSCFSQHPKALLQDLTPSSGPVCHLQHMHNFKPDSTHSYSIGTLLQLLIQILNQKEFQIQSFDLGGHSGTFPVSCSQYLHFVCVIIQTQFQKSQDTVIILLDVHMFQTIYLSETCQGKISTKCMADLNVMAATSFKIKSSMFISVLNHVFIPTLRRLIVILWSKSFSILIQCSRRFYGIVISLCTK